MLDLKLQTWLKLIFIGYIIIALGLKRKQLGRIWRDAFHALVRAKTPVFSWFSKSHEPEEIELTKKAAQSTKSPPSSQRFAADLASEPATTSGQDLEELEGEDLTRRGPEPTGKSEIGARRDKMAEQNLAYRARTSVSLWFPKRRRR